MNRSSPRAIRASRAFCGFVASIAMVLSAGIAFADVPGRVGRIAFIEGDVQSYSETEPDWKVAYINQPITSHNSVFVGDTGRAEITIGSTTLAMDAGSQVDIQQLDDNAFDANVVRGRVSMFVRRLDAGDTYDLAVPGADFSLLKPGRYRIDSLEASAGLTVFAGQGSVHGDRGDVIVNAGNAMRVVGDPADPSAGGQLESGAGSPTALDDWVMTREARFRNVQSERYVSPNMTGYEDLDANGRWATEADVGPVWYPTTYVQPDWAPYRYGRWAYVAPWGYTWIDDAPWGFAPFHYGRWLQVGNRWGWTPGAYVARPAFAPALVGFYGGAGLTASFAVGAGPAVGWYPLAPWQRYAPHYTQNGGYLSRVNNIALNDAPPRFRGPGGGRDWNRERGGTLAPRDAFASQRSISRVAIAAPGNAFDRGGPLNVNELPRPALVPGAIRRGADAGGRPDFRSPRDFAGRPGEPRAFDRSGRPNAAVTNGNGGNPGASGNLGQGYSGVQGNPGAGYPANRGNAGNPGIAGPNAGGAFNGGGRIDGGRQFDRRNDVDDRRFDGRRFDGRPQPGAPAGPAVPAAGQIERSAPQRDGRPGFDRDPNRAEQGFPAQAPSAIGGESQPLPPQRFTPRSQAPMRSDGETRTEQIRPPQAPVIGGERGFERPAREFRNMQPVPQPNVERSQRFERPAPAVVAPPAVQAPVPMRPAPVAPAAPVAPVTPVAPQPRVQSQGDRAPAEGVRVERGQIGRDR